MAAATLTAGASMIPEWKDTTEESEVVKERPPPETFGALLTEPRARLFHACDTGDSERVFLLIKKAEEGDQSMFDESSVGKLVDATTEDGATPLFVACKSGNVECARILLKAGATTTRRTKSGGFTPLWIAAQKGHANCLELMLAQRRTTIDQVAKDGRTPLYAACEGGDPTCVSMLLKANADKERRRHDRSTPLIVAAVFGRAEVIELLLAAGCRLKPRDEDGTALDNARKHRSSAGDFTRCIELLEAAFAERGRQEMPPQDEEDEENAQMELN